MDVSRKNQMMRYVLAFCFVIFEAIYVLSMLSFHVMMQDFFLDFTAYYMCSM